jgi:hypothetical protein
MNTMICSEALRLPTGPQLEDARFPRQGVGTERVGCPGGAQGRPWGRDGEDPGSFGCGRSAEASVSVLGGAMNSMGGLLDKLGPKRLFTRVRGRVFLRTSR